MIPTEFDYIVRRLQMRANADLDYIFSEIEKRGLIFLLDKPSRKMYFAYLKRKKELLPS